MKKRLSFKKITGIVHLWLGLASGLLLFIICLTGTIYVFRTEIEEWISPEKYKVEMPSANAKRLTPDELIAAIKNDNKGKVLGLQIPEDTGRTWQISLLDAKIVGIGLTPAQFAPGSTTAKDATMESRPRLETKSTSKGKPDGEKGDGAPRPKNYYVNPYTGKIISEASGENTGFFGTVLRLHRWFLLPKSVGSVIGGVAVLLFVFISLSGLIIWFPKKLKYWKQGLSIKRKAGWKRTNHDLHKSLGFYAVIFCLLWALTGLNWSFNWYKNGASKVLGAQVFGERNAKPITSKNPHAEKLSVNVLLKIADAQLSYPGTYRVQMPADTTGTAIISKFKTGFFAVPAADKLQLDAATGEVLKLEKFSDKRFNQKVAALIKPLHTGEIFGTFSKIIYFLMCLITTSLPVTGTLIWWNKRKKTKKVLRVERAILAEMPV